MKNSISLCGVFLSLAVVLLMTGCARRMTAIGVRRDVPGPYYDVVPPRGDGIDEPSLGGLEVDDPPIVEGFGFDEPIPEAPGELIPIEDKRWDDVIVYFAYDRSTIGSSERPKLEAVASLLGQNPTYHVVIEGHADERGSEEYNRGLSERRALAVKEYLATLGVSSSRMETLAYGEERPAVTNATEESQHARNRRAEFIIGVRR